MTRLGVVPSVSDAIRIDGPCPAIAPRFRSCFNMMPMHFPKVCLTTVLAHARAPAWTTIKACAIFWDSSADVASRPLHRRRPRSSVV